MSMYLSPSLNQRCARVLVLIPVLVCLGNPGNVCADEDSIERARLDAILRQMDVIDLLIAEEQMQPHEKHTRYYFDYTQLTADLKRVRGGIQDYLAPSRAQPRDQFLMADHYRQPSPCSLVPPEDTP